MESQLERQQNPKFIMPLIFKGGKTLDYYSNVDQTFSTFITLGCAFPRHAMASFSFTMNSSTWLFSMKRERVSRTLYLVNSWVVKTIPFVAKLQMALLNIFKVKSSSTKEQFSSKEVFNDPIMLYLLTNRPWREKFSQMTESIAKISRLREDFSSSSQSMRKTVTKNLRVNGKQNFGLSLMSSAMIDSTYIIRNSVCGCCSSDSKFLPSAVKWFIILLMRSTCIMKTDVYPFWKRWLTPSRHCQNCAPSAYLIVSASCCMAFSASVSSAAFLMESMRNSIGGFSRMMGKQEAQDQVDPDDVISVVNMEKVELKIIIGKCEKQFFYLVQRGVGMVTNLLQASFGVLAFVLVCSVVQFERDGDVVKIVVGNDYN